MSQNIAKDAFDVRENLNGKSVIRRVRRVNRVLRGVSGSCCHLELRLQKKESHSQCRREVHEMRLESGNQLEGIFVAAEPGQELETRPKCPGLVISNLSA